jgi:SHS2 domain-containing protein
MSYEWLDHTAELELRIEADSEEEVFREALRAFAELVAQSHERGPARAYELELDAPDRPALLVRWLEEFIYLAELEGFVPDVAEFVALSHDRFRARVSGRTGEPRSLVKAVTYHGLSFEEHNGRWTASVVFDV